MKRITLTRRAARVKLRSAKRATYYIQVDEGYRYAKESTVEEMLRQFERDERCRLRISGPESKHTVTISDTKELRSGYDVEF